LQFSVSALHRVRWVVAALLLMLHWAAPSLRPFDPLPGLDDRTPAYSAALNASVSGTLPRALARIQPAETGLAKAGRPLPQSSGPIAALVPAPFNLSPPIAAALPDFADAPDRTTRSTQPFDARAPPIA